jgi:hypothetical protein
MKNKNIVKSREEELIEELTGMANEKIGEMKIFLKEMKQKVYEVEDLEKIYEKW